MLQDFVDPSVKADDLPIQILDTIGLQHNQSVRTTAAVGTGKSTVLKAA